MRARLILLATVELCRARLRLLCSTEREVLAILQTKGHLGVTEISPADREWVAKVSWALGGMVTRLPFRTDCLVRLIAAQAMLSRRRIPFSTRVQFGRNGAGEFEAHCWIDIDGSPSIGGPIDDYHPLPNFVLDPRT